LLLLPLLLLLLLRQGLVLVGKRQLYQLVPALYSLL
jgi:hypothetical protein